MLYIRVASFTDAWIETNRGLVFNAGLQVASFTDAWIETPYMNFKSSDIESHLLQMRGLKHRAEYQYKKD